IAQNVPSRIEKLTRSMKTENDNVPRDPITSHKPPELFYKVDIVIIGAGQAGLSAAYHLKKEGIEPGKGFVILDDEFGAGGAWQHRWDSLTLSTVNGINDLPGMG